MQHRPSPPSAIRAAAARLAAPFLALATLVQCATAPSYEKVDYEKQKLMTPPHNMSRGEYPFDEQGNYRRDWVKKGGNSSGASSSSSSSSSSSPASRPPAPAPAPSKPASGAARYHTVAPGDTLFSISRRYGVTVAQLKMTNGLTSDLIRIGQSLRLP